MVASKFSRQQRKIATSRRLHILRTVTNSKSVKKSSIIMDAFLYILKLKLQLDAISKEYQNLIIHIQEVKVENFRKRFLVRVTCKNGGDLLAIVEDEHQTLEVQDVTQAVTMAITK